MIAATVSVSHPASTVGDTASAQESLRSVAEHAAKSADSRRPRELGRLRQHLPSRGSAKVRNPASSSTRNLQLARISHAARDASRYCARHSTRNEPKERDKRVAGDFEPLDAEIAALGRPLPPTEDSAPGPLGAVPLQRGRPR